MKVANEPMMYGVDDYRVEAHAPGALSDVDLNTCLSIIRAGHAVDPNSAKTELRRSKRLVLVKIENEIVAVGSVKRVRTTYAARIAGEAKSGFAFASDTPELGYVAVDPRHRGKRLSHRLVAELLSRQVGGLFATTDNEYMKRTLLAAGFVQKGREWKGRRKQLSLWIRT